MTAIKTRESAGGEAKVGSTQAKATMKAAVTTATTFVCRLFESRRRG